MQVQVGSPATPVRPAGREPRTSRPSWTGRSQGRAGSSSSSRLFLSKLFSPKILKKISVILLVKQLCFLQIPHTDWDWRVGGVSCCENVEPRSASGHKKALTSRKSSVIGFGERFSSLVSISSQVASTMMGVSELSSWALGSDEMEPNDLVDKLINVMVLTASTKYVWSEVYVEVGNIRIEPQNLELSVKVTFIQPFFPLILHRNISPWFCNIPSPTYRTYEPQCLPPVTVKKIFSVNFSHCLTWKFLELFLVRENWRVCQTYPDGATPILISSKKLPHLYKPDHLNTRTDRHFIFAPGKVKWISNLALCFRSEKLILTFCASINDLLATFSWKRKRIK